MGDPATAMLGEAADVTVAGSAATDDDSSALLIGRAVLRLVEIAASDAVVRDGLAALARVVAAGGLPGMTTEVRATAAALDAAVASAEPAPEPDHERPPAGAQDEVVPMDRTTLLTLVDHAMRNLGPNGLGTVAESVARTLPGPAAAPEPEPGPAVAPERAAGVDADPAATLRAVAERARLKAALSRARATSPAGPPDEALVHRARSAGCSLWLTGLVDPDVELLDRLASCFEAVADAAEFAAIRVAADPSDHDSLAAAVRILAAVQSALRVAVAELTREPDDDQVTAFRWLKAVTGEQRIFVERHMRLDDPLDPVSVDEAAAPARAALAEIRERTARQAELRDGLKQVRYHATRVAKGKGGDHDLDKIVEAVAELVADGLPPSNLELRALLAPIFERLPAPEARPAGYARVYADLEANRERNGRTRVAPTPREKPRSSEVQQVAPLLRGTELVVIGGERRVEAERALTDAFGLAGLTWFTLSDDPTLAELERAISHPAVSVVVQLIRWSRHRHGDAAELAEAHGKPFVRVPAGYNPNAMARAIAEQASARLRAERRANR